MFDDLSPVRDVCDIYLWQHQSSGIYSRTPSWFRLLCNMEVREVSFLCPLNLKFHSRWFDETPLGRIISRFTKDVQTVDWEIYQSVYVCCETATGIMTRLFGVILFSPIFVIPSMIVACCGFALGNIYLRCQLAIKRETRCRVNRLYCTICLPDW